MHNKQTVSSADGTPLISFIVPAYNVSADMLRACIGSILSLPLSAEEREIVVVDDGSDKPCIDQLNDYAEQLVYIRQKNGGLSRSRNTGIRCASGRYLQFVDADDLLIKQPYTECLNIVRKQSPDVVLFHLTDSCDKTPEPVSAAAVTSGAAFMLHHNLQGSACGYLFRKAILGNLQFTPGQYHEDEEFTPQLLLRADTLVATNAKAYLYRRHEGTITTSREPDIIKKRMNDTKNVILRLKDLADTLPAMEQLALERRVAQLTMDFIYKVIMDTRDLTLLKQLLTELRSKGLFPLPDRNYTQKYQWFRRMTNTELGIRLLMRLLPMMKRER